MSEVKQNKKAGASGILLIFAVLALSLPVYCQSFTTAALGEIKAAFPDVSVTAVKMISSIPSLMQLIFAPICAILEQFLNRRKLLSASFILAAAGGVISAIAPSFTVILVGRAVFGAGMGLIAPMALGLIAQNFEGEKRSKLYGYRSTFAAIFGIVFSQLGGILAGFGWRLSFWAYLVLVPIGIFVIFNVPDAPPVRKAAKEKKEKVKFPLPIVGLLIIFMVWRALVMQVGTNVAIVVQTREVATAAVVGTITAMGTVGTAIGGVVYGNLPPFIKKYSHGIGALMLGIALWMMTALGESTVWPYFVGMALANAGVTIYGSHNTYTYTTLCSPVLITSVMAASNMVSGLGQFTSPVIMDVLASIFKFEGITASWQLSYTIAIPAGILGIVGVAIGSRFVGKKDKPEA